MREDFSCLSDYLLSMWAASGRGGCGYREVGGIGRGGLRLSGSGRHREGGGCGYREVGGIGRGAELKEIQELLDSFRAHAEHFVDTTRRRFVEEYCMPRGKYKVLL